MRSIGQAIVLHSFFSFLRSTTLCRSRAFWGRNRCLVGRVGVWSEKQRSRKIHARSYISFKWKVGVISGPLEGGVGIKTGGS